ncbi:hypothetical protein Hamer_G025336 [Homarus americanus]|uniref:Uncharacterized protein n=1 Tax=Homarus americanus TaxID=6706 RepID=A0A8J5N0L7_HOMAM|nr:hypothetical protein Hamer_G025336 [Homarus americanus]
MFSLERFVNDPSLETLYPDQLRKIDWISIASYYEINVQKGSAIQNAVLTELVREELISEEALQLCVIDTATSVGTGNSLELRKLEMEHELRLFEEKRKHELAMEEEKRKTLEVQDRVGVARPSNNDSIQNRDQSVIDITKHLETIIPDHESDPELLELSNSAASKEEADDLPVCFYSDFGLLMRNFRPPSVPDGEDWHVNKPKLYYSREVFVCVMEIQEPRERAKFPGGGSS